MVGGCYEVFYLVDCFVCIDYLVVDYGVYFNWDVVFGDNILGWNIMDKSLYIDFYYLLEKGNK